MKGKKLGSRSSRQVATIAERQPFLQAQFRINALLSLPVVDFKSLPIALVYTPPLCVTAPNLLEYAALKNAELPLVPHLHLCHLTVALATHLRL